MTIDAAGEAAADQYGLIFKGSMPDEEDHLHRQVLKFNFKDSNRGFDLWVDSPGEVAGGVEEAVALIKKRGLG